MNYSHSGAEEMVTKNGRKVGGKLFPIQFYIFPLILSISMEMKKNHLNISRMLFFANFSQFLFPL